MFIPRISSLLALSLSSVNAGAAVGQFGEPRCKLYKDLVTAANASILAEFNTTILDVSYVTAGSSFSTPGSCQSVASSGAAMCRIQGVVKTTSSSAVHFEAYLPDQWTGRFLALGNTGFGGCIDYSNLDYTTQFGFAAVASDNGHDGNSGIAFLNHPEVINDFTFRAIHTNVVIGKLIVKTYYWRPHSKSYYFGCSLGGRQGMQSALLYPEDFDGILAGAPTVDHNHLTRWQGILGRFVGAPTRDPIIPLASWHIISQDIMNKCDGLDGVVDGIITDPDGCSFNPESLLCSGNSTDCLNTTQVAALKNIYRPFLGLMASCYYDPGVESLGQWDLLFNGSVFPLSLDWWRYAIFNDSSYSFENFSVASIEFADKINPGGIATWNEDFSPFRDRGGEKSCLSTVAKTSPHSHYQVDDFYRLFLIPGMQHCGLGPGAWIIGQGLSIVNDTTHNVLLALVDWMENVHAPDVIIGTSSTGAERTHCRYPHPSVFDGTTYVCN